MKMRKILPLVLLAVGSLFLLSGCDALLDAIFANNQILVDVAISNAPGHFPTDWIQSYNFGLSSGRVVVTLTDVNTLETTITSGTWSGADLYSVHYTFSFTGLKDDVFQVSAVYTSFYTPPGGATYGPVSTLVTPHSATGHSADVTLPF